MFILKEVSQYFPISHGTLTAFPLWKDIISRILVIKFRPKQDVKRIDEKWSDRKGNWVVPLLLYNLQKLIGFFLISFIRK